MDHCSKEAIGERLREAYRSAERIGTWAGFVESMMVEKNTHPNIEGDNLESVRLYRSGKTLPRLPFLMAAAGLLEVRPAWLIWGEEPMKEAEAVKLVRGTEASVDDTVVLKPLWKIGIENLRLPQGDWEEQRRRFNDSFEKFEPDYDRFTPLVKAMLGNAAARRIKAEPQKKRLDHRYRVNVVHGLMEFLLIVLKDEQLVRPLTPRDREFTDYAIGVLHSLMVAMPTRPER